MKRFCVGFLRSQRLYRLSLTSVQYASSSFPSKNPYQILGVEQTADHKTIKDAFFTKSKENHPDLNPDSEEASEIFQEVVEAYEYLSDSKKKKELDDAMSNFSGTGSKLDWKSALRKDRPADDFGRKVNVDMSKDAMKRRWELYRKHWEGEEDRLRELEELKTVIFWNEANKQV